jgi:PTS system mannose-specific IIA component
MKGLIVAAHANMAEELLHACELIIGPLPRSRAISVRREDSVDQIRSLFSESIDAVGDGGAEILIMTDMLGGTPANIGMSFLEPGRVDLLTGVNLPMLLKFYNSKESLSLNELTDMLKAYGQQAIHLASDLLKRQG